MAGLVPTVTQLGRVRAVPRAAAGGRLDRRRLIVGQFGLLALALAFVAVAPSAWLLVWRPRWRKRASVAQQIVPLAAHLAPPERRGATVGTILAGILTGILLSRTLAGFVATHGGWRQMFWLGLLLALAAGALMRAVLPPLPPQQTLGYPRLLRSILGLWREFPALRRAATTRAHGLRGLHPLLDGARLPAAGPLPGMGADVAGAVRGGGAVGVLAAPVTGRFVDRKGPASAVLLGAGLALAAWAVFGLDRDRGAGGGRDPDRPRHPDRAGLEPAHRSALRPEARARLNTVLMGTMFGRLARLGGGERGLGAGGWGAVCAAGLPRGRGGGDPDGRAGEGGGPVPGGLRGAWGVKNPACGRLSRVIRGSSHCNIL